MYIVRKLISLVLVSQKKTLFLLLWLSEVRGDCIMPFLQLCALAADLQFSYIVHFCIQTRLWFYEHLVFMRAA